jgi:hypothetical protein
VYVACAYISTCYTSADLPREDFVAYAVVEVMAEVLVTDFNLNFLEYVTPIIIIKLN